jgi:hypothetical protein
MAAHLLEALQEFPLHLAQALSGSTVRKLSHKLTTACKPLLDCQYFPVSFHNRETRKLRDGSR